MKKSLQLTIPKPCHENWNAFTPTRKGGFCQSCSKEVIDFTRYTDEQVIDYFKSRPQNTCGRFRPNQLKTYTLVEPKTTPRLGWLSLFLGGIMLFFTSRFTQAQSLPKTNTEQIHVKGELNQSTSTTRKLRITGVVNSLEDGTPIPGVNVFLKGTVNGTATDVNGEFELQIAKLTGTEVLVFSFIGLKTIEYPLGTIQPLQKLVIEMELDTAVLAGEIIMGGIGTRKISLRRLWWRIKGLF
jgi:hypothetical protein